MTPERYHQIDALAEAALNMDTGQREAFLQRACGSDHDLLVRVTQLVRSHLASSEFLELPALESWARDVASSARDTPLEHRMIGRYQIVSRLGSGGGGQVWLAKDLELKRDVALKVLSPDLAGSREDAARFRQEAYAASSLNHPNLITVFDIGEFEGRKFIAQEYVAGRTLRQILREGRPAVAETLRIAAQVTEGLKAAHAAGIVHRDIKPENIMVRPDGVVKLLDFGLARVATQPPEATDDAAPAVLTLPGMIVGTVRYMSPEQARGLPVDARADLFSLGGVIYELLAGAAPFNGSTPSDILAAILTADVAPLSGSGVAVPAAFERVVRRCLEKDPSARYPSAAALARDLERIASGIPDSSAEPRPVSPQPARRAIAALPAGRRRWLALATVGVASAAAAVLLVPGVRTRSGAAVGAVVRSSLTLPAGHVPEAVAISPAGTEIVYQTSHDGVRRLYRRYLEEEESRLVPGSEGGTQPFFSPDGQELAFYSQASIRVVGHGSARDLVAVPSDFRLRKAIWADDGFVYYTTPNQGVCRVSARGGKPEPAVPAAEIPEQPAPFLFPQQKLDGNPPGLLLSTNSGPRLRSVIWAPLFSNSPARVLVERGMGGQVLSSGHLIYLNQRKLFAAPFNPRSKTLAGSPVEVIDRVAVNGFLGPSASVSRNGTLVYIEKREPRASLMFVDRNGRESRVPAPIDYYEQAELSPDGGRMAISRRDGPELWTLWIYNLRSGAWSRVMDIDVPTLRSVWAPDGKSLIVSAVEGNAQFVNLYRVRLDTPQALERLTENPQYGQFPGAWSRVADLILFTQGVSHATTTDILAIRPGAPGPPRTMVATKGADRTPAISPDGRWFAYSSAGANAAEVFVQPLDQSSAARQASSGGGASPAWSPDGRRLYYLDPGRALMEAPFHPNGETGPAHRLLPSAFTAETDLWTRGYSVGPDGRFLVLRPVAEEATTARIRVIVNWTSQLDRLAPVGAR